MRFGEKGDPINAKVAGTDASTDLALLKIDPDKADGKPLPLGSSGEVRVGEPVIAIGSPFGLRGTVTRASCRRSGARSSRPTASRSTASSRPTPRSTPATRAAR